MNTTTHHTIVIDLDADHMHHDPNPLQDKRSGDFNICPSATRGQNSLLVSLGGRIPSRDIKSEVTVVHSPQTETKHTVATRPGGQRSKSVMLGGRPPHRVAKEDFKGDGIGDRL
ncbi:hypothetical protein RRG08_040632 [Elysia crispata]|uniref:Uncharacterized protein n=1 Tax=Elysia crispata TaxID=231223 RepID=A0AAE1B4J1_9GAST|nr:hypothetical protein RRG08_040632 [Elysia crispata]